jgi:nucleoid DNA-binding protein
MKDLIAPELFQNSTCTLPGIGTLSVITHPAETAFISGQIKAPVPEIVFYPSVEEKVFNEFTAVSMLLKNELEEKGEIILSGIGSFTKDEVDNIQFIPDRVPAA